MNLIEIEREYYPRKQQGESYSTIRKELIERGLNEEQIKVVIRSIDNKILQETIAVSNIKKGNQLLIMGLIISSIGFILTIGTYSGWINIGNVYVFAYGPIISGFGFIGIGLNKRM